MVVMGKNIEKSINFFPTREKLIKDASINNKKSFLNFHNIYG